MAWRDVPGSFGHHVRDAGLPWLFAEAFLLMGGFVCIYNYIGFRLLDPPFSLSQTVIGLDLFRLHCRHGEQPGHRRVGEPVRPAAGAVGRHRGRAGRDPDDGGRQPAADRRRDRGRDDRLLRRAFGGEQLGRPAGAPRPGPQASSIYLCLYYLGSSVLGAAAACGSSRIPAGTGVVLFVGTLYGLALAIAIRLSRLAPLPS